MRGLRGLVYRELKMYTYSTTNVVLSLVTPVFYALLLSTALGRAVGDVIHNGESVSYAAFVVPGLAVLALLTSSMMNAQSVFQERDSGMLLEIMSCPITPRMYVLAKYLGTAIVGTSHALLLFSSMTLLFGLRWATLRWLVAFVGLPVVGVPLVSVYLVICGSVKTIQTFLITMNLVSLVMMFASTIFYPQAALVWPLNLLSMVNPVTISSEMMRSILLGPTTEWVGRLAQVAALGGVLAVGAGLILERKLKQL
ncbi:MAG TPA: hypothetical protein DCM14_07885 [Clostridiales bacterium UBA8153]|nr:hypothetical protein [Clostridiales bacterium UBA8153]